MHNPQLSDGETPENKPANKPEDQPEDEWDFSYENIIKKRQAKQSLTPKEKKKEEAFTPKEEKEQKEKDAFWEDPHGKNGPTTSKAMISRGAKKKKSKIFVLLMAIICFILLLLVFFLGTKDKNPIYNVSDSKTRSIEKTENEFKKEQVQSLPNYKQFDFSPLEGVPKIEPVAILPKRYLQSDKSVNEFEALFVDARHKKDKKLQEIIKKDYNRLTSEELQDLSRKYLPTWKVNAVSMDKSPRGFKSIYAIVLDYDVADKEIEALLPADTPLTLAIEAYEEDAQAVMDRLRPKGYEFILQLPMQGKKQIFNEEVGQSPLRAKMSFDDIKNRLAWHNNKVKNGHIGFKNKMPSDVLAEYGTMNWMMNKLSDMGLTFLEVTQDNPSYQSVAFALTNSAKVPSRKAKYMKNPKKELSNFFKNTLKDGSAVVVIKATKDNLRFIAKTLQEQKENNKDITIVPLSYIYTYDYIMNDKVLY